MRNFFASQFAVTVLYLVLGQSADADLIAYEGFDYTSGDEIKTLAGGTGWTNAWNGDSEIEVGTSGLSYTDSFGNQLEVTGNSAKVDDSSGKKIERTLNFSGSELWTSFLVQGVTGNDVANFSLEQKLSVGQGEGDINGSNWTMHDQDGLVRDSGLAASSSTHFIVTLVEFSGGDERAWFWINPDLSSAPAKSDSVNGASGDSVKDFELTKVQAWLGNPDATIDEIRLGTTFADVAPFTAIPEPSSLFPLLLLSALMSTKRRRK